MIWKALFSLLFAFAMLKIPKNYAQWTGGFRVARLQTELSNQSKWDTAPPNLAELKPIFLQPFSFFKRGSQSYVFVSGDQQWVLKIFFRSQPKRTVWQQIGGPIFRTLPDEKSLNGYCLAAQLPHDATGLVYLHLNTTENLLPSVSIRDALGREISLPLDPYRFVVQKKCDLLVKRLRKAAKLGESREVKNLIDSYLACIAARTSFGIRNSDTEFKRNFGCQGSRVVEFDFGEYIYDPALLTPEGRLKEFLTFAERLRYWAGESAPEYEKEILDRIAIVDFQ